MSAPGNIRRLRSGAKDNWRTPRPLFEAIGRRLRIQRFVVDLAADQDNTLCEQFITAEEDALRTPWPADTWLWCNPPYSQTKEFVDRAVAEMDFCRSVLLVPAATDTRWWADAFASATVTLLLTGRVSFVDPETGKPMSGNTTGSTVFVFGPLAASLDYGVHIWDWKKDLFH